MTLNSLEEIREWCSRRLTEKIIHDLDVGQALAVDLYKEFAANGWLESLDVFGDSDAFRQGLPVHGKRSAISLASTAFAR